MPHFFGVPHGEAVEISIHMDRSLIYASKSSRDFKSYSSVMKSSDLKKKSTPKKSLINNFFGLFSSSSDAKKKNVTELTSIDTDALECDVWPEQGASAKMRSMKDQVQALKSQHSDAQADVDLTDDSKLSMS